MGLQLYKKKRDFKITKEPEGKEDKSRTLNRFVIQKHDASHLHYDFRLEIDGVLKSWAVPKGPSLDPKVKRLAMEVEDHPLEYRAFEGKIPEHQYGAGTVIVWDNGNFVPVGDPSAGWKKGRLEFDLKGKKLAGRWNLVRTHGMGSKNSWLLMKKSDDYSRPESKFNVTEEEPASVKSGRTIEELEAKKNVAVWNSNRGDSKRNTAYLPAKPTKKATKPPTAKVASKKKARALKFPEFIEPQLAQLADHPPEGADWIHEIKFDGYRTLTRIQNGDIQLLSRNGLDWTKKYGSIVEDLKALGLENAWMDGEVVALGKNNASSFSELQRALKDGDDERLYYYIFDLLILDDEDLRAMPLGERKAQLKMVLASHPKLKHLVFSDHIEGGGSAVLRTSCQHHLEGVVSKMVSAPYLAGRGTGWVKSKCSRRQEVVIGGYTDPQGSRAGFGSLLVGARNAKGQFQYVGRVGTGFSGEVLKDVYARLKKLAITQSPFEAGEPVGKKNHWVKPTLVAEVDFPEWTEKMILRHPSFQGLREDKRAKDVVIEMPADETEIKRELKSVRAVSGLRPRSSHKAVATASKKEKAKVAAENDSILGVTLSHPDKVLFPDLKLTKRDVAHYYESIAGLLMPYIENRPLTLVRCPDGVAKACFFQKHANEKMPSLGLKIVNVSEKESDRNYYIVEKSSGLVSLVQMGCFEFHSWQTSYPDTAHADQIIFDLDPDAGLKWRDVVTCAVRLREMLEEMNLKSFIKLSGGKGVHIQVPLNQIYDWDEVKSFSKIVAEAMEQRYPKQVVSVAGKAKRTGKIFIDYLRNGVGATAVLPYCVRARAGAGVAMPIDWRDLSRLKPDQYTLVNAIDHISQRKIDPWKAYFKTRQNIEMLDQLRLASATAAGGKKKRKSK